MRRERAPHRVERPDGHEIADATKTNSSRERQRIRPRGSQKRLAQSVEHAPGFAAKIAEAARVRGAGERANGVGAGVFVCEKVEAGATAPCVMRKHGKLLQCNMVG
jgi:hypothetical protein